MGAYTRVGVQITNTFTIKPCADPKQLGFYVHLETPPGLQVLRLPFGRLIIRGADILSIWEDNEIGPVAQYWPKESLPAVAQPQLTGNDRRMITADGSSYRVVSAARVRIQYDAVGTESAEVFDGIIDSACEVSNLTEVLEDHNKFDRFIRNVYEGQLIILNHPLYAWAEPLYSLKKLKKKPESYAPGFRWCCLFDKISIDSNKELNSSENRALTSMLNDETKSLQELLYVIAPWLNKVFDCSVQPFKVTFSLSTFKDGPIATVRKVVDGYVIDINLVVLRSLFRASTTGDDERRLFEIREELRVQNPYYPLLPDIGIINRVRDVDISYYRFTDVLDFVLLHELGHIVLGHDLSIPLTDCDKRKPLESKADDFAASILTLRDPYRLRIRRPGIQVDRVPGQSTYRDFFTSAYTVAGFGNAKNVCGYPPAEQRREETEHQVRKTLALVY
jgi:hypothetical protein